MADDLALSANLWMGMEGFALDLHFEARREILVIFGPSGAGKSMTLRVLAGLRRPDQGRIELCDRVLFDSEKGVDLPPQRRRIGYVPQDYGLFPHRSIQENIAYGLHDLSPRERARRVGELLALMRLEPHAARLPAHVSGGEAQRTALARALAIHPDLLLMDEPFAAVEGALRDHLRNQLQRLQEQFQIPVLLVTHNLEEAYLLADQLLVLERGQAIQSGGRDEVFRNPKTPGVARLMGMSNIFEGSLSAIEGGFGIIDCAGLQLKVPQNDHIPVGARVQVGIRPEDVIVVREHRPLGPNIQENLLEGRVIRDQALGFDHQLTIALGPPERELLQVNARIPHPVFLRLNLRIGDRRQVSVKPESIHLFPLGG